MGERWGERLLLATGTLITAVSFASLGFADGLLWLVTLLALSGLGAAVQHPLASSMVSKAYHVKGRRVAIGSYNFAGDVGKVIFPALAAVMLSRVGWRPVCVGFGLLGCLITIVLFFILRKAKIGERVAAGRDRQDLQPMPGWGILKKGAFVSLSVIAIVDTAVRIGLITFIPFFLIQKGIVPESAGFALSLLFVGGAAGKFFCGMLAEHIGTLATIIITEAITGIGILLLTVLPLTGIYFFLPFLGVALNGTSSVLYGTVGDFVHPRQIARAFGLFYTFVIATAAAAPPVIGSISDLTGVYGSVRLIGCIALITVPLALILSRQMRP